MNPSTPNTTGINPWWTYEEGALPGTGKYMVNVGNGNLIVQSDDIDIPERGIDLAFRRTYNSGSLNDTNAASGNDDGSPNENVYGNGWTNTFDTHLAVNSSGGVSVFDIDGARYDYTPNGTGCLTAPTGVHNALCWDGGCGYFLTKKSGAVYHYWAPSFSASGLNCGGWGPSTLAYQGRLYMVIERDWNNWIQLTYSWLNGDASTSNNLTQIVAGHQDGQQLVLSFGIVNGRPLLSSITLPNSSQVTYSYSGAHDLISVGKLGNNSASVLTENYGYYAADKLAWTSNPRWNAAGGNDGSFTNFYYDGSNRVNGILLYGFGNITPNDGTNTPLQPISTSPNTIAYSTFAYPSGSETSLTDIDGHAANWLYDSSARVTQAQEFTGNGTLWLVTNASWDAANNLTEALDARGNAADYAYDTNGNVIAVALPSIATNQGTFRPTTLVSYDRTNGANNIVASCDPARSHAIGGDWTANPGTSDSLCPSSTGSARFSWDYSSPNEPFGRLSNAYSPVGYHVGYSYASSAQGGDFGLPSDMTGDCITQVDGSSRCSHQTQTYDAYGNVVTSGTGIGTWTAAYDAINRITSSTDPDGVTNRICYFPDGSAQFMQTARQYALDGNAACGSHSVSFTYDADGNSKTETHHFNNVQGITQRWYDGADRLVEVSLPSDSTDIFSSWLTRYIYDISAGGQVSVTDSSSSHSFYAHGNLFKSQRYVPGPTQVGTTVSTSYVWYDTAGTAYDNADRTTSNYRIQPGGNFNPDTLTWDSGAPGALAAYANAAGDSMSVSYDPAGNVTQRTYSSNNAYYTGGLPTDAMTYDADGRIVTYRNDAVGTASMSYNADGNLIQYTDPAGGSGSPLGLPSGQISSPTTYTYTYYADGLPSNLSLTASALAGGYTQQFDYRVDNLLTKQVTTVNGTPYTFSAGFSNAGRIIGKTDPLANPALVVGYDGYGGVSTWSIPSRTYSSFSYDPEGEVTGFSAGSTQWALSYSDRGELLSEGNSATPSTPIASFRSAAGFLYPTAQTCNGTDDNGDPLCATATVTFDARTSAELRSFWHYPLHNVNTVYSYDLAGRRMLGSEYDALNRSLRQSSAYYSYGAGRLPTKYNAFTHHAIAGAVPMYTTDSGGAIQDLKISGSADILPNDSTYQGLTVYDRDFFGFVANERNSTGASAWTLSNLFSTCDTTDKGNLGAATTGFQGSALGACTDSGALYQFRTDGFFDGTQTFRGARTYLGDTQQWTSPDQWGGNLSQPLSALGYNYANNNPAMFSDPSGFVTQCEHSVRQASIYTGQSTGTQITVCFDDGQMLGDEAASCQLFCDFGMAHTSVRAWNFANRNIFPRLIIRVDYAGYGASYSGMINGCGEVVVAAGRNVSVSPIGSFSVTGGAIFGGSYHDVATNFSLGLDLVSPAGGAFGVFSNHGGTGVVGGIGRGPNISGSLTYGVSLNKGWCK